MAGIDLHMHSVHSSDGEVSPEDLVALARASGLTHISITDHNRTLAVWDAVRAGKEQGVAVIPGIEVDCLHHGLEIHMLGYFIDPDYQGFVDLWDDVEGQELENAKHRINYARDLGIAVNTQEVMARSRNGVVTAELVAEVALADPENRDNPLLAVYRPGGSRDDNPFLNFYWDYCSPGKPAHVKFDYIPASAAIKLIKDSGGIPVVAHPGKSLLGHEDLFPEIVELGAEGLEAYCSYHSREDSRYWSGVAAASGILTVCGSDYHGKIKPSIRMGGHGCENEGEVLDRLLRHGKAHASRCRLDLSALGFV